MKRFLSVLILTLSLTAFASFSFAQSAQGTVTIRVQDQDGKALIGNWGLHQGTTPAGLLVRNGTKGETFALSAGNYFLVATTIPGYHAPVVTLGNPQALEEGGHVFYQVVYNTLAPVATSDVNTYDAERVAIAQEAARRALGGNEADATSVDAGTPLPEPSVFIPSEIAAEEAPASAAATATTTSAPLELAQTGSSAFLTLLLSFAAAGALILSKRVKLS